MARVTKLDRGQVPTCRTNPVGLSFLVSKMNLKQRAELQFEADKRMLSKNKVKNRDKIVKRIMRQFADRESIMQASTFAISDLMGFGLDKQTAKVVFMAVDGKHIRNMGTRRRRAK